MRGDRMHWYKELKYDNGIEKVTLGWESRRQEKEVCERKITQNTVKKSYGK